MHERVTASTKSNKVVLGILAGMTPILLMVYFKIAHRATQLTSPSIAPKHLLPQLFILGGKQAEWYLFDRRAAHV